MSNAKKLNLPGINLNIAPEDPEEKKARLEKQSKDRAVLESLGIDTSFRLDSAPDPIFPSVDEQREYEKDCFLATMFVKTGTEIPEDLKQRLLEVKRRREDFKGGQAYG